MKKLMVTVILVLASLCVFAGDLLVYRVETEKKDSEKYSYSFEYPVFDTNSRLGIFANKNLEDCFFLVKDFMDKWEAAAVLSKDKETVDVKCVVSRCEKDIISGYFRSVYTESGNVHTYFDCFNYGIVKGLPKVLDLTDCYGDKTDILWAGAYGALKNNPKTSYIQDGTVSMDIEPDCFKTDFVLTKNYITFIFDPGVLAPQENGEFMYKIKYTYFAK